MRASIWLVPLMALGSSGCTDYVNEHQGARCAQDADCMPGKTCGQMQRCKNGRCDPNDTYDLPCEQGCERDADCPQGMHCRAGTCAIDGSCAEVGECQHAEQADCTGVFTCEQGLCVYHCLADDACESDADCLLADAGCCCGHEIEDYVALHAERLEDWRANRFECWVVDCPPEICSAPDGLTAICEQGRCAVDHAGQDACERDADCAAVPADCCGCEHGGGELAVREDRRQDYLDELYAVCALIDPWCADFDACTDRRPICHGGRCMLSGQQCGCGEGWDPVCAGTGGAMMTYPNACQAECAGLPWRYHGRCDCMVDCFRADPVCASNGETYWCGEFEARCNGQSVVYPGECSPECDQCLMLGRPSIPVCTEDFETWNDVCFAECHGVDYWHEGFCLEGEGSACNTEANPLCPGEDLFCLTHGCFSCTGRCIALGHCLSVEDCPEQPLPVDDCVGHWECRAHACAWICD
ncbi:MAG: hypothetical protein JXR96_10530 [Deltaproteobacteria bacterium]|nr:hypothetical protein [Deltaproteobacteria bacterium]